MTRSARIGERPSAFRIDDRRPAHMSVSPETDHFRPATTPAPSPAGFAATPPAAALQRRHSCALWLRCGRTFVLGALAPLAGFDLSTTGRFSGVHRGYGWHLTLVFYVARQIRL